MHPALGGLARNLRELDVALTWLEKGLTMFLFAILVLLGLALVPMLVTGLAGEHTVFGLIRLVLVWLLMLGAVHAVAGCAHPVVGRHCGQHLRLGSLTTTLVSGVTSGLVCLALAWAGWKLLVLDVSLGSSSWAGVPAWPALAALPIGFGLMALRFTLRAVETLGQVVRARSDKR